MKKIAFVFLKEPLIEPLGVLYLGAIAKKCRYKVGYFVGNCPELHDFAPDFVCFSIITGDQEKFKQLNSDLKTSLKPFKSVVGGPHVSFFPRDCDWADHKCIGEGEAWLEELLSGALSAPYAGIDAIPWPIRPTWSYVGHFITTRGCPYACSYCYNKRWQWITGKKIIETRDVRDVVDEIDAVNSKFVYFQDDCFGININWLREFAEQYNKSILYHCHVRPEMATPERVELLRKSGCRSVHMAIETANEGIRRYTLNRKMKNTQIVNAVRLLHDAGIAVMTQNMIGLPATSINQDLETLELNIALKPEYAWCSIYQPYPGTVLGEQCKQAGLWDGDISKLDANFFGTSRLNFTREHITQIEILQKLFAFYVANQIMPAAEELNYKPALKTIYTTVRRDGDIKLFGEVAKLW